MLASNVLLRFKPSFAARALSGAALDATTHDAYFFTLYSAFEGAYIRYTQSSYFPWTSHY